MSDGGEGGRPFRYIGAFPTCRLLVVGDIMLDEYIWGSVGRISPEAPVPVIAVRGHTRSPGGAANVAFNIAGLGAKVHLAGLVGADSAGRDVVAILRRSRIDASAVVADRGRPTTVKTRVIAHSQQVVRVDREENGAPGVQARDALREKALALVEEVDGVVLSDYRKGVLSPEMVSAVIAAARRSGIFVAVDPKRTDFSYYRGCTLITPNKAEAEAALGGRDLSTETAIWEGGKALLRRSGAQAVLITRGEEGMSLVERGRKALFHIPTRTRQVFDVTGAGDTVIGTIAVGLGAGATLRDAALLANAAAGVVVGEVGTVPITTEKLKAALRLQERERELFGGGERAGGRGDGGGVSPR
jgi:D-glycero-beta-D-manno-heptose-7-phosphate kinase